MLQVIEQHGLALTEDLVALGCRRAPPWKYSLRSSAL
jgi:hypothetical protein